MTQALERLEALNLELCAATGAGKGADTTPESSRAYRDLMFSRRAEVAAALADARWQIREYADQQETRALAARWRTYADGIQAILESVTHP